MMTIDSEKLEDQSQASLHKRQLEQHTPKIPGRIPSLDGLRALSILLVLLGHTALSFRAPHLLRPFSHVGNIGVRFFFIISGFLITTLLLKEWKSTNNISLRGFYKRRVLRIFPAAYTLIAVIAILAAFHKITLKPGEVFYASTFTMNYHDFSALWLGQLWSLSVEEQFYLLWPGLLLFVGIRGACRSSWIVILFSPILRFCMWHFWGASETSMTKHFEVVADALATGCLLAAYFNRLGAWERYRKFQSNAVIFLGIGLGLIALGNGIFVVSPGGFYVWGQSVANIGTAMCIDWAIRNPKHMLGHLLNWKPLAAIGILSYSLYLWQNPFLLGDNGTFWTTYPYNVVFVVIAALISYFVIERPFLRLKDLGKKRHGEAATIPLAQ
jgi:peptidoglycan/LPS O-acetylase OafA/YrhL